MTTESNDPRPAADKVPMNWVMVLWMISFLIVTLFGVLSFFLGLAFRRTEAG